MTEQTARKTWTAGSLFAGIGGFCKGLADAGIKVLWANENDSHAAKTYRENYPETRLIEKDVLDLSVAEDKLEPVDILTAGFPCQSFSMAGNRKGFDDERGRLFFEIMRIVKEFDEHKPKILLLENVPHLQHGGDGEWFHRILKSIQQAGYWCSKDNYRVLNTAEVTNVPHRRERLFMAAVSMNAYTCNNFQFPSPVDDLMPLDQLIDKSSKEADNLYMDPDNRFCKVIAKKMASGGDDSIYLLRRTIARENKGECPPLTANMGSGGHNVPFIKDAWGIRKLTVTECAGFQGFRDINFPESVPTSECYKQIGNAVSVPVAAKLAQSCIEAMEQWELSK